VGRHSKQTGKKLSNYTDVLTDIAGPERDKQIGNADDRQTLTDK